MTRAKKDIRHEVLADLQSLTNPVGINTLVLRLERGRSHILVALRELAKAGLVSVDPGVRMWKDIAPEKLYRALPGASLDPLPEESRPTPEGPKGLSAILAALEVPSTPEQIASVAKVSVRHVRNVLSGLVDEGLVTRRPGQRSSNGGNMPQIYEKQKQANLKPT